MTRRSRALAEEVFDNPTGWVADHVRRYYARDRGRHVLVATPVRGGGHPSWYLNVLENPVVVLQVRADTFAALARPADASERPRLWELMLDVFPKYEAYEREAARELPVVVVERASARGEPDR